MFIGAVWVELSTSVQAETRSELPPGDYVYWGADGTFKTSRSFRIDESGTVLWIDDPQTSPAPPLATPQSMQPRKSNSASFGSIYQRAFGAQSTAAKQGTTQYIFPPGSVTAPSNFAPAASAGQNNPARNPIERIDDDFEAYQFPIIKWKIKAIAGLQEVYAQVTTKLAVEPGNYGRELVRYQVILSKVPQTQFYQLELELLDDTGFKISSIGIPRSEFHPVPHSQLLEAKGDSHLSSQVYRTARGLTVTAK